MHGEEIKGFVTSASFPTAHLGCRLELFLLRPAEVSNKAAATSKKNFVRRFFSVLGPGLITGAADDDPSGIATYSIAGAQMGTSLLWTALITWPLMGCVQFMCARIGMVTGTGLAAMLKQKFPRWVLVIFALALFAANTINVGSDLARYVGCRRDAYRFQFTLARRALRHRDRLFNSLFPLFSDR